MIKSKKLLVIFFLSFLFVKFHSLSPNLLTSKVSFSKGFTDKTFEFLCGIFKKKLYVIEVEPELNGAQLIQKMPYGLAAAHVPTGYGTNFRDLCCFSQGLLNGKLWQVKLAHAAIFRLIELSTHKEVPFYAILCAATDCLQSKRGPWFWQSTEFRRNYKKELCFERKNHKCLFCHLLKRFQQCQPDLASYEAIINKIFIDAGRNGNTSLIQMLLLHGMDPNVQDENGDTALHHATRGKHLEAIKILLQNRAFVNVRSQNRETSLILACDSNNHDICKLFNKFGHNR